LFTGLFAGIDLGGSWVERDKDSMDSKLQMSFPSVYARPVTILIALFFLTCGSKKPSQPATASHANNVILAARTVAHNPDPATASGNDGRSPSAQPSGTNVEMHNVFLREKSGLKIRVRWLRGVMYPTRTGVNPSFDDLGSFALDIQDGVLSTRIVDLSDRLSSDVLKDSRLTKAILSAHGKQIKLTGKLSKGVPLPIEMIGDVSASADGRIRIHVAKLHVLKIPVKGLFRTFDIKAGELLDPKGTNGVQATGDDIYVDSERILPRPHKHGKLTDVHIASGDLIEVYGSARPEVTRVEKWRNYIRLRGGTVDFGKLTMHDTDLMMIDVSQDAWFELDTAHYYAQMVNGFMRMTPQAGLQVFMPDVGNVPNRDLSLQWLKNRKVPPPTDLKK
jgi:hypothetical protein